MISVACLTRLVGDVQRATRKEPALCRLGPRDAVSAAEALARLLQTSANSWAQGTRGTGHFGQLQKRNRKDPTLGSSGKLWGACEQLNGVMKSPWQVIISLMKNVFMGSGLTSRESANHLCKYQYSSLFCEPWGRWWLSCRSS